MPNVITVATERHTISFNIDHIASVVQETHYDAVTVAMTGGTTHSGTKAQFAPVLSALGIAIAGYREDVAPFMEAPEVRPAYCLKYGHDRAAYLAAQQQMFAAARKAGLDTNLRDEMIFAISEFLNVFLTSRKEIAPAEMIRVTGAIERGQLRWNAPQLRIAA